MPTPAPETAPQSGRAASGPVTPPPPPPPPPGPPETDPIRRRTATILADFWPSEADLALRSAPDWAPDTPGAYCPRCGVSVGPGVVNAARPDPAAGCPRCRRRDLRTIPWDRVIRLGPYADPLGAWVRNAKYRRRWGHAAVLGRGLGLTARRLPGLSPPADAVVVPVPLHWRRRWARGFNPSALLAEGFARAAGPRVVDALVRRRPARPQARLGRAARQRNLRGAFAARRVDLTGRTAFLVDDVMTTGATLGVCTRLLKRRGAAKVVCVVAAVTDPPDAAPHPRPPT